MDFVQMNNGETRLVNGLYDGRFIGISIDGVISPDWFKITEISNPVMASVELTTQTINGRHGTIVQNAQLGAKEIKVTFIICNDTPNYYAVDSYKRILAGWLAPAIKKDVELIIGTDVNIRYKARITGEVDLQRAFMDGTGTITFYCADPIGIGDRIVHTYNGNNNINNPIALQYSGTCETYPRISFNLTKDITNFQLISNDEFVEVGEPMNVGATIDPWTGWVINNKCESTNGLSIVDYINGADATGRSLMIYHNYCFKPVEGDNPLGDPKNYSGWFGTGYLFQGTRALTDFRASATVRIKTSYYETQTTETTERKPEKVTTVTTDANGKKTTTTTTTYKDVKVTTTKKVVNGKVNSRVQYSVRDANNSDVVVVRLHDNKTGENGLWCEVFLVNGDNKKYIVDNKKIDSKYSDFYGTVVIQRVNNVWTFTLNYYTDDAGTKTQILSAKYTDGNKTYFKPVRHIATALCQYKDNPLGFISINHAQMEDLLPHVTGENQVVRIAQAGDSITIDNETGDVYKNDSLWIENINPASTFISLDPNKTNALVLAPDGITNAITVEYDERYY